MTALLGRRHECGSDEELLTRAQHGDAAALEVLYDRYGSVVYGLAVRMLGDLEVAASLVEDAFRAVAHGWPDDVSAEVRIVTHVHRAAIELRREKARARPVSERETDARTEYPEGTRALRALSRVPGDQRKLLVLAYCDGYTIDELAEHFAEPREAVGRELRDGMLSLREALVNDAAQGRSRSADVESRPARQRLPLTHGRLRIRRVPSGDRQLRGGGRT